MTPPPSAAGVWTLANGLTVAAERRAGAAFSLSLRLPWGSVHDPLGCEGTAGVLEEWLFKGAGGRDARALSSAYDALGLALGGGAGTEASRLSLGGLSGDFAAALKLLADTVQRPHLPENELPVVADLARQDLESLSDDPADRLAVQARAQLFGGSLRAGAGEHLYAGFGHPVSGTPAGLHHLSAAGVRAAHARWGGRGSILAVVMDAEPEAVRDAAESAFGGWTPGAPPDTALTPPYRAGTLSHLPHAGGEQTHFTLLLPAPAADESTYLLSQLALAAFSGGSASRLFQAVREERGLAYQAHASSLLLGTRGFWQLTAGSTPARAPETLDVCLAELHRLSAGLSPSEFALAQRSLRTGLAFAGEGRHARASALVRDLVLFGRLRWPGELHAELDAVTLEQVNAFLAGPAFAQARAQCSLVSLGTAPLHAGHLGTQAATQERSA